MSGAWSISFVPKPYNQRVVKARINSVIKLKESAAALSAIEYDDLTGLYTKSAFYYHAGILMRYKPDQSYVANYSRCKEL